MKADTRYETYFVESLGQQPDADRPAAVQMLLEHVERSLTAQSLPPDLLESELRLARDAAARLLSTAETPAAETPPAEQPQVPSRVAHLLAAITPRRALYALLALAIYLTPLFFFLREGQEQHIADAHGSDIGIELNITVADFAKETVVFQILPAAGSLIDAAGHLTRDVVLKIDPGTGPVTHTFKANAHIAPWTLPVYADSGDILDYPFDRYHLELDIDATVDGKSVKAMAALDHVPHGLKAELNDISHLGQDADVEIRIRRSGTIVFLALLSTLSLLLVSTAACAVAWQVTYRGRKIEFSMMVWVAALLFVVPTVRNGLPGSPPAGSMIDFLVFFWLQIAVAIAMSSLVLAWVRRAG